MSNTVPYICDGCSTTRAATIRIPTICGKCGTYTVISATRNEIAQDEIQTAFCKGVTIGALFAAISMLLVIYKATH